MHHVVRWPARKMLERSMFSKPFGNREDKDREDVSSRTVYAVA